MRENVRGEINEVSLMISTSYLFRVKFIFWFVFSLMGMWKVAWIVFVFKFGSKMVLYVCARRVIGAVKRVVYFFCIMWWIVRIKIWDFFVLGFFKRRRYFDYWWFDEDLFVFLSFIKFCFFFIFWMIFCKMVVWWGDRGYSCWMEIEWRVLIRSFIIFNF